MLKIAFSPIYKYELPEGHRFPMDKYELLPKQLIYEGTVTEDHFFYPSKLSDEEILLTHSSEYLDKLNTNTLSKKEIRKIGFPVRPELIDRGKYIAMGTYECTRYAMKYGAAMNIAGGTHHSFADRGEGFCIFNDIAISSNLLLDRKEAEKILIVDLDVHQGNGTASIFRSNDQVFTFSMHGEKNYPVRKEESDLDIGLPDQCDDELYLNTLYRILPDLIKREQPDIVFYLSGVDVLRSDKLGRLGLSKAGCRRRDEYVLSQCHDYGVPVVVSMGGGYSERLADIIDAHANTYRIAQEIFF